jgi:stage II sporulation protein P
MTLLKLQPPGRIFSRGCQGDLAIAYFGNNCIRIERGRFWGEPQLRKGLIFLICFCGFFAWGLSWFPLIEGAHSLPLEGLLKLGLVSWDRSNWRFFPELFVFFTGIDLDSPLALLQRGLPMFTGEKEALAVSSGGVSEDIGEKPISEDFFFGMVRGEEEKPVKVAFYHTHNAETYIPLDKKSKVEGRNGGVSLVAEEMVRVLEEQGIRTIHDLTLHDYPDFARSYIKSEVTATRLINNCPNLKALIDVHRDAGLEKKQVANVDGKDVAKILIIVGTGERLANPHWRENYAFAQAVAHKLEERFPGVLKEVRLMPGRYNQHLFSRALLVEVGSEKNTLEEALGAARCFALALAEVLHEEESEQ